MAQTDHAHAPVNVTFACRELLHQKRTRESRPAEFAEIIAGRKMKMCKCLMLFSSRRLKLLKVSSNVQLATLQTANILI